MKKEEKLLSLIGLPPEIMPWFLINETENLTYYDLWPTTTTRYIALISAIVLIFLCIIGIAGNALSIAIFIQHQFRQVSINLLLLGLSVADLLLLILAIPVFVPAPLLTFWPTGNPTLDSIYSFGSAKLFPLVMVSQCASVWLLVAITVERWAAVCRPLLVDQYFTPLRALLIILTITIMSILYNLVRFWEFTVDDNGYLIPLLRVNKQYMLWRITVAHTITTYLLPLAVLVSLSALVIRADLNSRKFRSQMTTAHKGNLKTARMLIFVVLMFIICYTLSLVLNLWELLEPSDFQTASGESLSDLNNILAVLNSATTWMFYLKFSTRYRQGVKQIPYLCLKRTSYDTIPTYSVTMSCMNSPNGPFRRRAATDMIVRKTHSNRIETQSYGTLSPRGVNSGQSHFPLFNSSSMDTRMYKPQSCRNMFFSDSPTESAL